MSMLKAVILDVDGTLVDSNDAHAQAFVEALQEYGHEVPFSQVRQAIGMGSDKLLPEVAGIAADSPLGRKIAARKAELFERRFLPHLQPTPGARALLERLRAAGLKRVVASSADDAVLGELLRAADVDDLIDAHTAGDAVAASKPDADVVVAALEKMGLTPQRVVMLGDTPYDVEAGRRAGVDVVAFRCGGWTDTDLAGAIAIYDDPADLVAQYAWSPFALPG
jgi:HAD superfamily hydrolase (TIGR01509 family)